MEQQQGDDGRHGLQVEDARHDGHRTPRAGHGDAGQAEHGERMGDSGVRVKKAQRQRRDKKAVIATLIRHGGAHDLRFFLGQAKHLASARIEQHGFQQHDIHVQQQDEGGKDLGQ